MAKEKEDEGGEEEGSITFYPHEWKEEEEKRERKQTTTHRFGKQILSIYFSLSCMLTLIFMTARARCTAAEEEDTQAFFLSSYHF